MRASIFVEGVLVAVDPRDHFRSQKSCNRDHFFSRVRHIFDVFQNHFHPTSQSVLSVLLTDSDNLFCRRVGCLSCLSVLWRNVVVDVSVSMALVCMPNFSFSAGSQSSSISKSLAVVVARNDNWHNQFSIVQTSRQTTICTTTAW